MTKRRYEEHKVRGHVKYHPGCKHCVMMRALADTHHRFAPLAEEADDPTEPPVISADFCFPGDKDSADPLTVLVMTDPRTKRLFAHSRPGKATTSGDHSEYIVTKVVGNIDFLGNDKTHLVAAYVYSLSNGN